MNNFWVKIVIFGIIVAGLIVMVNFLSNTKSHTVSEPESAEKVENIAPPEPVSQPEVKQPVAEQPVQTPDTDKPVVQQPEQIPQIDEDSPENIDAQRLYSMAEFESKLARKPMMTYYKMVNYCRQILEKYPNTIYAEKARALLRKMPEHERSKYNITDKELGL